MKWISDQDDQGFIVLGFLVSVLAGVLGTVIGGPKLGWLSFGVGVILFGTLIKATFDAY